MPRVGPALLTKNPAVGSAPSGGHLDVIGSKALLRLLERPLVAPLERVAGVLSAHRGAIVPRNEIAGAIWGEYSSGGPLSADQLVGYYVALLRRAGLPIATFHTRGYGLGFGFGTHYRR